MSILDPVDFSNFKRVEYNKGEFSIQWMKPILWLFTPQGKKTTNLLNRLKKASCWKRNLRYPGQR